MKRADQRRAKRPRSETTEADPKKPTGDANRDYKAALLEIIRQIGVGEVRKQLGEVEMGYNPAKEKRQDDASRELSRSKEKRQEEANAIEGREENDPPEQELTETETASEVLEPPEASKTKELANIEAATRARQDARLSVPVQQDNGNGRFGIGMPLYLVGTRKELRENAEKRESDLKNKENDEKQEEKRNKHDAEVRARAMEKHVTTSPPKSAASEQGCRCNAVDDSETPAGFCLNIQNQSVRKPAPTAPVTAEKATKEETAATTKMEERSALEPDSPEAKNEAGNVSIAMPPPPPPPPSRDDVDKAGDETFPKKWKKDSWWEGEEKEEAESTRKKEESQWDNEKEVHQSSWSKEKWRGGEEEWDKEPPRSSWGKRKWQDEIGKGDEDSAQPKWKKQSWRQDEEKIDDHHAGSSKVKWRDDKEKGYQEQSQSSWGKQEWRCLLYTSDAADE